MFQDPQNMDPLPPPLSSRETQLNQLEGLISRGVFFLCPPPNSSLPLHPCPAPLASPATMRSWPGLARGLHWWEVWLLLCRYFQSKPLQANNWRLSLGFDSRFFREGPTVRPWPRVTRIPSAEIGRQGPVLGEGGLSWGREGSGSKEEPVGWQECHVYRI